MFPTASNLEDLIAQLKEYLAINHREDGTHGDGWQRMPYSDSYFLADGVDADWTVNEADVATFRYRFDPNTRTMDVALTVNSTTVASAPGALQVRIPLAKKAAWGVTTFAWLFDNGTRRTGIAYVDTNGEYINIARLDNGPMTNATNNTNLSFLISFECQP